MIWEIGYMGKALGLACRYNYLLVLNLGYSYNIGHIVVLSP